eukprot:1182725-Prorocentrum_minimum.AAC.3
MLTAADAAPPAHPTADAAARRAAALARLAAHAGETANRAREASIFPRRGPIIGALDQKAI